MIVSVSFCTPVVTIAGCTSSVYFFSGAANAETANAANAIAVSRLKNLRMKFIFVSPVGSDEESSVRAIDILRASRSRRWRRSRMEVRDYSRAQGQWQQFSDSGCPVHGLEVNQEKVKPPRPGSEEPMDDSGLPKSVFARDPGNGLGGAGGWREMRIHPPAAPGMPDDACRPANSRRHWGAGTCAVAPATGDRPRSGLPGRAPRPHPRVAHLASAGHAEPPLGALLFRPPVAGRPARDARHSAGPVPDQRLNARVNELASV